MFLLVCVKIGIVNPIQSAITVIFCKAGRSREEGSQHFHGGIPSEAVTELDIRSPTPTQNQPKIRYYVNHRHHLTAIRFPSFVVNSTERPFTLTSRSGVLGGGGTSSAAYHFMQGGFTWGNMNSGRCGAVQSSQSETSGAPWDGSFSIHARYERRWPPSERVITRWVTRLFASTYPLSLCPFSSIVAEGSRKKLAFQTMMAATEAISITAATRTCLIVRFTIM